MYEEFYVEMSLNITVEEDEEIDQKNNGFDIEMSLKITKAYTMKK